MIFNILIGCVTYSRQRQILAKFLLSLKNLKDYSDKSKDKKLNLEILFVDNSIEKDFIKYLEKEFNESQINIKAHFIYDDPESKNRIQKIITGRNNVRKFFLQNKDYTHLFFLDTDVIVPPFTLNKLLDHSIKSIKTIFAGVYLGYIELPSNIEGVFPIGYAPYDEVQARQLQLKEVLKDKLIRVIVTGLGCVLIPRIVLEKVIFRNIGTSSDGGEDAAFFVDVKNLGFETFLDTSIKCDHWRYPLGNKRNDLLMFKRYIKD